MKSPRPSRFLGVWRVFLQDLVQLLEGFTGIVLVFILPPLLLGLVGQLSVVAPPFKVLVAGSPSDDDREVYEELVALLGDISSVEAGTAANEAVDPLADLHTLGLDLIINLEGDAPEEWIMYTAAESRSRLASIRQFAAGLERALHVIEPWATEQARARRAVRQGSAPAGGAPAEPEGLAAETERWATELGALGSFTPRQMMAYYPRALDRTIDLASGTLVLIICFLPFVLAAPSFIREKEAHTLEVMLAAPGIDGRTILAGKCLFVLVVTFVELLLLVVVAESVYSIQVKSGFPAILLLFLPAILATAFLGLTVSALARAQAQIGQASALFFLAITLLTGFFVPLEEASLLIRGLSQLFPLTIVLPVFKAWTVGAQPSGYALALGTAWVQCLVYSVLALAAVRLAIRRV